VIRCAPVASLSAGLIVKLQKTSAPLTVIHGPPLEATLNGRIIVADAKEITPADAEVESSIKLFLLHHDTNKRLSGVNAAAQHRIRAPCPGDPLNTIQVKPITERIKFADLFRSEHRENDFPNLSQCNLHCCLRRVVRKRPGANNC
jgi:hypothetical protein